MARPTGRPGQQQVLVRMPDDPHAALVARSEAEERSMAQTIRFALRQYLRTPTTISAPQRGEHHP